jgi:hypothetical protein
MDFLDEEDDDFFGSQKELDNNSNTKPGGNDDDDDDDAVNREGVYSSNNNDEFGSLMQMERSAKESELKTVAFLDAFDEYKESKLQEGFEFGMLESLEGAIRIGKLLGKHTTVQNLVEVFRRDDDDDVDDVDDKVVGGLKRNHVEKQNFVDQAKAVTRDFFANKFQKDTQCGSSNCEEDLQSIEDLLQTLLLDQADPLPDPTIFPKHTE